MNRYESFCLRMRVEAVRYEARLLELERLALERLTQLFEVAPRSYVAVSAGKDSLLCLHLARMIQPDVISMWRDEWHTMDTQAVLDDNQVTHRLRCERDIEFYETYGVMPNLTQPIRITHNLYRMYDYAIDEKMEGVVLGIREDESNARRWQLGSGGAVRYVAEYQQWRCAPLSGWRTDDVWRYTISRNLPVHPTYAKLIEAGIPLQHARVGGMTTVRVFEYGVLSFYKQHYADDYHAMLSANPCMVSHFA